MDKIVKAEMVNIQELTAKHNGPTAQLTTQRGKVYYVWIDFDGVPLIEFVRYDVIPTADEVK